MILGAALLAIQLLTTPINEVIGAFVYLITKFADGFYLCAQVIAGFITLIISIFTNLLKVAKVICKFISFVPKFFFWL